MLGADLLHLNASQVPRGRRTTWFAHQQPGRRHRGGCPAGPRPPAGCTAAAPSAPADFATGLPDLTAFPRAAWLRAEREVLATASRDELGYGHPQGARALRHELSGWLARSRGVRVAPERLIVTSGVSHSLSLLAQVLGQDGLTQVAVEDPGAEGMREILGCWTRTLTPVTVDEHGLDVAKLRSCGAPAVVVTPAHQFPTGVALAPSRRRELAAWSQSGGLVIEDDYDVEFRYDRAPIPAFHSLAPGHTAYTASLSKMLAPALRTGWLVVPPSLHDRVVHLRWSIDLSPPVLPQLILAHLLVKCPGATPATPADPSP